MKTLLNLYIDGEVKSLAKSKGINLSRAFEEFLGLELELINNKEKRTDKEEIKFLKSKLAIVSGELNKKSEEVESLRKKNKPEKERFIDMGVRK